MNATGDAGNVNNWILAVNLIIWTGIFFYLLHLNRKLKDMEKDR